MATVVNKTIQVYPKQRQFLESKALWRAFVGGIGSGKSFIGALDMIRRAKPDRLYLVTAPTYPMLSDASFRSFVDVARSLDLLGPTDVKQSPPPSVKLRTGAEVLFRSTDNPEMLRGPNLSGWWMDEASLSKREAFDILVGRLRGGNEMGWGTATFTPKGKIHWTYKVFGKGAGAKGADVELVHARTEENVFLPPEFVENVRKHYTAQQIKQELGGAFIDSGGNHYFPDSWPRYVDTGDAYRVRRGDGRWHHYRKAECSRLLALDWAMGKPKKGAGGAVLMGPDGAPEMGGDCTAFVVADMTEDEDALLFPLWAMCERVPMGANAPRLAEVCRRWEPVVVAGDDDNLTETMLLECRRYRDIPTIKTLPIRSRNKLTRSQAAIVRAERGKVYIPDDPSARDAVWVETLCDQLAAFTGADGEPDDLADCVAILGRLADEMRPGEDRDDEAPVAVDEGFAGFGGGDVW